jgi:hypothetical protein
MPASQAANSEALRQEIDDLDTEVASVEVHLAAETHHNRE